MNYPEEKRKCLYNVNKVMLC